MKVVLDLSQLLEDGEITQAEAEKLKRLSVKSTGSLAFNILIGFGVIAVAIGAILIVPNAVTGIILGAIVLGFGLVLLHYSPMEWGVLANICVILGALGLGGGVVYMTEGSVWAFLGCAIGFAIGGVIARSGLLIALAVIALSSVLGARTGYFHASYFLGIKEPTLTVIAFSLITLACYQVSLFVGAAYERLALMAARVSILLVNFGFWIGSLWGDRIEQLRVFRPQRREPDLYPARCFRCRLGACPDCVRGLGHGERPALGRERLRGVRRDSFLYAVLRAARARSARGSARRRFRARDCDCDLAVQQEGGRQSRLTGK